MKECFGGKTTFYRWFVEVSVLMDTWGRRIEKDLTAELKGRYGFHLFCLDQEGTFGCSL